MFKLIYEGSFNILNLLLAGKFRHTCNTREKTVNHCEQKHLPSKNSC